MADLTRSELERELEELRAEIYDLEAVIASSEDPLEQQLSHDELQYTRKLAYRVERRLHSMVG
jgi:hypothetical protein